MSNINARTTDIPLEISKGNVRNHSTVNKFGRSTNADEDVKTDVWDGANSTDTEDTWVAPNEARIHEITSTSANDAAAGTGARTIKIYGLTSWDADEVSEIIGMNGTTAVATSNAYVIIHRMKVISSGAANINAGTIKATAQTDSTVTAQINVDEGQTQMAVYGVPSTKSALIMDYYCSAIRGAASLSVAMSLLVNTNPDEQLDNFLVKHTIGIATEGDNYARHQFGLPLKIEGPAIIKMEAYSSANNTDVSAGFDLALVDND